jgi:ribose 5-phosphate isomerase A
MTADEMKRRVGQAAAEESVGSGMKIGMGTGSTAVWAIRRIGELMRENNLSGILAVPTSFQATLECQEQGIPVRSLNDPEIDGSLDLTIDGADEVDHGLRLTKGGGAALFIEKLVAYNSARLIIVVDESKLVENLGISFAVPIEVHPEARIAVTHALERLGLAVELRMAVRKMGPVVTDNGNILLDAKSSGPIDPVRFESELNAIPGVVENGLFTRCEPKLYVGRSDGSVGRLLRPR